MIDLNKHWKLLLASYVGDCIIFAFIGILIAKSLA